LRGCLASHSKVFTSQPAALRASRVTVAAHGATNRASDSVTYGQLRCYRPRRQSTTPVKTPAPPQANLPCFRNRNRPRGDCRHLRLEDFSLSSPWAQGYDPTGHWWLSHILAARADCRAARQILALGPCKGALRGARRIGGGPAHRIFAFHMPARLAGATGSMAPVTASSRSAGSCLSVIFMYQLTVESGQFNILQHSLTGITQDRRLQLPTHRLLLWSIL